MDRFDSCWHSAGDLALPGGMLQWRWSGQRSELAINEALKQQGEGDGLLQLFLKKQEDLISLFVHGLVQGPRAAGHADSNTIDAHQKSEVQEVSTDIQEVSRDSQEPRPGDLGVEAFHNTMQAQVRQGLREEIHGDLQKARLDLQRSRELPSVRRPHTSPLDATSSTRSYAVDTPQREHATQHSIQLGMASEDLALRKGGTLLAAVRSVGIHNLNSAKRYRQTLSWIHWWSTLQEPRRDGSLAYFVHSTFFQAMCVIVISLNTGFMLQSSNFMMKHRTEDEPTLFWVAEAVFLVWYCSELALKIWVHRLYFFCNDDMAWNLFDVVIVVFSCVNALITSAENNNLSFLRTFRILKLSKIFRIFRVIVFLRDLRVMLSCVVNSFLSLIWCFALLALIMVIFAIFFVQSLTRYLTNNEDKVSMSVLNFINSHFPTVQHAMVTLYMVSTGGLEWGDVYNGLMPTGFINYCMLLFFIGFFHVSIFNVTTGLFVEKAMKFSRPDQEMEILEHRRDTLTKVKHLKALVQALDLDTSGSIEREEFMRCIRDPHVRFAFILEGLDIRDAEAFFDMLAIVQGKVQVDIDTFVAGCLRMRGFATSVDLQTLGFELKTMFAAHHNFNHQILSHLQYLESELCQMDRRVRVRLLQEGYQKQKDEGVTGGIGRGDLQL